jgi:methyl-accepting chemotaxis protein
MTEQNLLQQIKEMFQSGLAALEDKLMSKLATKEELGKLDKKIDEVKDSLSQDIVDAVETITDVVATKENLARAKKEILEKAENVEAHNRAETKEDQHKIKAQVVGHEIRISAIEARIKN